MTQKQVDAINAACRNGFSFDRYDFAVSREKRLSKIITLVKDRKEVKLSLSWRDEVMKVEMNMAAWCQPTPAMWCRSYIARYGTRLPERVVGTVADWGNTMCFRTKFLRND